MAIVIYKITNTINSKVYVGQTNGSLKERLAKHKSKTSHCLALLSAIEKYGIESFNIEEIATVNTREEANQLEQQKIAEFNAISPNGYNLTTGGSAFNHLEETKKKIGKSRIGYKFSEECKKKISEATKGRIISVEQRAKISAKLKGNIPGNKGKKYVK